MINLIKHFAETRLSKSDLIYLLLRIVFVIKTFMSFGLLLGGLAIVAANYLFD